MTINKSSIEELFKYHPPVDAERQSKHDAINEASIRFAVELAEVISNPAELTTLLRKIQEVRMLANQAVTYDAVGLSYRAIFIGDDD
jgi:uncharacterized protein YdgA (DUF945 family)